jgi:hypothetical protein
MRLFTVQGRPSASCVVEPEAARAPAAQAAGRATSTTVVNGEVHTLRFIRQARDLGFSIHEIGELLSLWHNRRRPSRLVKALAEVHIQALEHKAQELLAMKATLEHLVHCCHGDERPECRILDVLANNAPPVAGRSKGPTLTRGRRRASQPHKACGLASFHWLDLAQVRQPKDA